MEICGKRPSLMLWDLSDAVDRLASRARAPEAVPGQRGYASRVWKVAAPPAAGGFAVGAESAGSPPGGNRPRPPGPKPWSAVGLKGKTRWARHALVRRALRSAAGGDEEAEVACVLRRVLRPGELRALSQGLPAGPAAATWERLGRALAACLQRSASRRRSFPMLALCVGLREAVPPLSPSLSPLLPALPSPCRLPSPPSFALSAPAPLPSPAAASPPLALPSAPAGGWHHLQAGSRGAPWVGAPLAPVARKR